MVGEHKHWPPLGELAGTADSEPAFLDLGEVLTFTVMFPWEAIFVFFFSQKFFKKKYRERKRKRKREVRSN